MKSSEWVAIVIAGMGILGTLGGTLLAQFGEAKRATRAAEAEAVRRMHERQDLLDRERREAVRTDYREVLRFVTRTRLFVMVLRDRVAGLETRSNSGADDSRDVEDIEARSEILRTRLLEELPDVQSLVGVWAPSSLLELFDQIPNLGPEVTTRVTTSLHFKVNGQRTTEGILNALESIESLLTLLNEARRLLQAAQVPTSAE